MSGYYPPVAQNGYGQMPYEVPVLNPYVQMMQFSQGLMHDNYYLQNQLYSANNIISELEYKINQKTEKIPRKFEQDSYTEVWTLIERDGRKIKIGKLKVKSAVIVNMHEDLTFDAIYCIIDAGNGERPVVIPYKELYRKDNKKLLQLFRWEPDCSPGHFINLFYYLLFKCDNKKILETPKISGWSMGADNIPFFASSANADPVIEQYYPVNVKERQLYRTDRAVQDIAKEYAKLLPNNWKYKLLVAIRITSMLLYFYEENGLCPDQAFVFRPANRPNSAIIAALLQTQNYEKISTCSLLNNLKEIREMLALANDGMVLFEENSLVENKKKLESKLEVLMNDMQNANGTSESNRHLISIISNNPANLPDEFPAYYLSFDDSFEVSNAKELQRISGEFDCALIQSIMKDSVNSVSKIHHAIESAGIFVITISNAEKINTIKMVYSSAIFLNKYGIVTDMELHEIQRWLEHSEEKEGSDLVIVNKFREVFNHLIQKGSLKIVPQYGPPYYEQNWKMAFIDKQGYINFETKVIKNRILVQMIDVTQSQNRIFSALKNAEKMNSKKDENKRMVDVTFSENECRSVSVYSVSRSILDKNSMEKANESLNDDFFFPIQSIPEKNFVPLICNKAETRAAGVMIESGNEENFHMFVSGKTGLGKSYFLAQQAIFRADIGTQVILFDTSGTFNADELKKHLSSKIIDDYVSIYDIYDEESEGLPFSIFSGINFGKSNESGDKLFSILSAATGNLGEKQEPVLIENLNRMLEKNKGKSCITAGDILEGFEDEEYPVFPEIVDRLGAVLKKIKSLETEENNNIGWDEFLKKSKKVVIISAGSDSANKSTQLIDMILASLYQYKVDNKQKRITVIVDEIEDQNLAKNGSINKMLRKLRKCNLTLLLATQKYSEESDNLGNIIGNTGIKVFFRPKDEYVAQIAKKYKLEADVLRSLEKGACYIEADLYCKSKGCHRHTEAYGVTAKYQLVNPSMANTKPIIKNRLSMNSKKFNWGR